MLRQAHAIGHHTREMLKEVTTTSVLTPAFQFRCDCYECKATIWKHALVRQWFAGIADNQSQLRERVVDPILHWMIFIGTQQAEAPGRDVRAIQAELQSLGASLHQLVDQRSAVDAYNSKLAQVVGQLAQSHPKLSPAAVMLTAFDPSPITTMITCCEGRIDELRRQRMSPRLKQFECFYTSRTHVLKLLRLHNSHNGLYGLRLTKECVATLHPRVLFLMMHTLRQHEILSYTTLDPRYRGACNAGDYWTQRLAWPGVVTLLQELLQHQCGADTSPPFFSYSHEASWWSVSISREKHVRYYTPHGVDPYGHRRREFFTIWYVDRSAPERLFQERTQLLAWMLDNSVGDTRCICRHCVGVNMNATYLRCKGCCAVSYCNAECATRDWPKHKRECRAKK